MSKTQATGPARSTADDQRIATDAESAEWRQQRHAFPTVPRLLATLDAMRVYVEALAARNDGICPHCHRTVDRHNPVCVVLSARAFLERLRGESEGQA